VDGRAFLHSARHLLAAPSEANWRSAVGRAYYGLLHEGQAALQRWGFPRPAGESLHVFVRRRLNGSGHPDLRTVGQALDDLSPLRNQADYRLNVLSNFASAVPATQAVARAQRMVDLLDHLDADPARRAAAVAALRAAFP
jgi:hypothetical protein